ncbi:hypothetical protein [Flavobacterium sp. FlaQc-50]|uniref:hypothetical protein n=1 Tax=unclassified Flavobacterium TaxID=196869 RepID=UPI003756B60B
MTSTLSIIGIIIFTATFYCLKDTIVEGLSDFKSSKLDRSKARKQVERRKLVSVLQDTLRVLLILYIIFEIGFHFFKQLNFY